ncbi:syntaxin-binding protein 3 [Callorhinchus milii]|uniref:Syntaxin-binding protein 3-like protein n=1 Tax=Callorhinchus milii TaxID=7868 RepID=V9KHE9_CALMI|nr:syntaxin-binding protein 3 [Callorhinchus milii]|eukprot:gi/632940769/ref/XP_007885494.1/ PREDICTED: syntaxin-binding protein 3 [Callorhinchus milii]
MATAEHGLKRAVWQKIKTFVLDDCKKEGEWKILILDNYTTKLLSSCCKMSNIMTEGITVVEDLYKNREPVPDMKAVYFITPSEKSVHALIKDFSGKQTKMYKAAYVYFNDYCSDQLFSEIKASCSRVIKTCKEINISFLPYESQVFTLDAPDAFQCIYSPQRKGDKNATMEMLADGIVTLCATLDENPGVTYRTDPGKNGKDLADLVEKKLGEYYDLDQQCNKKGKTQSQLLIIDRGFDAVSTLLHELTFQAMAHDLVPIEKDIYKYQKKGETEFKEATLNEDDELWVKLRHLHIAEVAEKIPKLVKELSTSNKATEGKVTISSLAQMMKKMPHFRKQMTKQTVHLSLAEDCMKPFHDSVEKLCKAEQDLAMGVDAQGQKIKDPMRTVLPILLDKNIKSYDKLRIILLYIFNLNGTTEENLSKLIQHGKIEDCDIIKNWNSLGVSIISKSGQQNKPDRKDRAHEETYQLSRWTPFIKDIMEDSIANKLNSSDWSYSSKCCAAWNGSGAVSARQGNKSSLQDDRRNGLKLIVFIIGGVTYSEIRCAYEVTEANKLCEVIIGSTHILTPTRLLDDLKKLNKQTKSEMSLQNEKKNQPLSHIV